MSERAARTVLVAELASTLPLAGVIALVQLVSYPLFALVDERGFVAYHAGHVRLITLVVAPLMLVELAAASAAVLAPSPTRPRALALVGLALVVAAWGTTALASVPAHDVLARGFDARAHEVLVTTNWLRTIAWWARAAIVVVVVERHLAPAARSP